MDAPLSAQEVLENLKDRWYQADKPPSDLLLTEEEFLSFLHPEHSRGMLQFMVREIVRDLGEAWGLARGVGGVPPLWLPGLDGGACCSRPANPPGGRSMLAGPGLGASKGCAAA